MIVGIVGVGLLGGSMGYILKKKKWAKKVIGIGRNEKRLQQAVDLNAIDTFVTVPNNSLSEIDLLVVCVPVLMIPKIIKKLLPYLKKGVIITDVGSTKGTITEKVEEFLPEEYYFVGGHPMAGSEKTGIEALDPFLFENAFYVVTESEKTNQKAKDVVIDMIRVLSAKLVEMDVEKHDEAVAAISHLPHLIASTIVNTASEIDENNKFALSLSAGGFRDTTRVASGSPEMWKDICLTNRHQILEVIDKFQDHLNIIRENIENEMDLEIYDFLGKAKVVRDKIPKKRKGIMSPMFEIVVFAPDKPGVIADITNILKEEDINITDIEVLHVRENEGGSIRLGVQKNGNELKAVEVLKAKNYEVKIWE